MIPLRWSAFLVVVASIALVAGCKPKEASNPNPPPAPGPGSKFGQSGGVEEKGPHAAGIKVFNSHCKNCHSVGEDSTAGARKKRGPNLAKVAADPEHTEEWLRDFILDPRSKKPNSKGMPAFQGKINDEEFKDLVAYLASLK